MDREPGYYLGVDKKASGKHFIVLGCKASVSHFCVKGKSASVWTSQKEDGEDNTSIVIKLDKGQEGLIFLTVSGRNIAQIGLLLSLRWREGKPYINLKASDGLCGPTPERMFQISDMTRLDVIIGDDRFTHNPDLSGKNLFYAECNHLGQYILDGDAEKLRSKAIELPEGVSTTGKIESLQELLALIEKEKEFLRNDKAELRKIITDLLQEKATHKEVLRALSNLLRTNNTYFERKGAINLALTRIKDFLNHGWTAALHEYWPTAGVTKDDLTKKDNLTKIDT